MLPMELLIIESMHQYIQSLPDCIYKSNPHFQPEHQQPSHNISIYNIIKVDSEMFLMEREDYSEGSSIS